MRGRRNIYLLCKDDKILSFRETLDIVCQEGSIDLAILFLATQHLLPPEDFEDERFSAAHYSAVLRFVTLEEAGSLLSHRQASRPGDDVVIWSLLVDEKKFDSAESMWKDQIRMIRQANRRLVAANGVKTGFLLSSAPRIKEVRGVRWAPTSPTLEQSDGRAYLAGDGHGSVKALITPEGLKGQWGVHRFGIPMHDASSRTYRSVVRQIINAQSQHEYRWAALLQPLFYEHLTAHRYRGNADGPLFAVCGSKDGQSWVWCGLYEWNVVEPLPEFKIEQILLV